MMFVKNDVVVITVENPSEVIHSVKDLVGVITDVVRNCDGPDLYEVKDEKGTIFFYIYSELRSATIEEMKEALIRILQK